MRLLADRSFRSLTTLFETDSKLVLTRLQEGISLSYKFQAEAFGVVKCMDWMRYREFFSNLRDSFSVGYAYHFSSHVLAVIESSWKGVVSHECIFTRFYVLCKPQKTARQSFLYTLVRLFETDGVWDCSSNDWV